jgi:hypothetical protein
MNHPAWRDPQTFRTDETGKSEIAQATPPALYARSLVTSGRGQPTMTIQALAFRAADHIVEFARRGEI